MRGVRRDGEPVKGSSLVRKIGDVLILVMGRWSTSDPIIVTARLAGHEDLV
jgi:hypothetical protein